MPNGIKVWSASGAVVFDSSQSIGKLLGVIAVSASVNPTGIVSNSNLSYGVPFYYFQSDTSNLAVPQVTLTSSQISWYTIGGDNYAGNLFYGIR